ncbi:MAG: NTP pyrophosphatase (non-canonical NTP hydrolase) [Acidimicrobiales bacterium]|jgi:NTP pyrophosphatase (non-canonical NTP hydrolase)
MNFKEYQEKSRVTAIYPNLGDNLPYLALGIAGEAGEVADKVKKFIRDENFTSVKNLSEEQKNDLAKEMGDILWYIAQIATEFNLDMESVAQMNIDKLYSRMDRKELHGSGDSR